MSDNDPITAVLRELVTVRRRLESNRFLLTAILVVTAVCLALLLILASRAM